MRGVLVLLLVTALAAETLQASIKTDSAGKRGKRERATPFFCLRKPTRAATPQCEPLDSSWRVLWQQNSPKTATDDSVRNSRKFAATLVCRVHKVCRVQRGDRGRENGFFSRSALSLTLRLVTTLAASLLVGLGAGWGAPGRRRLGEVRPLLWVSTKIGIFIHILGVS